MQIAPSMGMLGTQTARILGFPLGPPCAAMLVPQLGYPSLQQGAPPPPPEKQ